jgi:hypothetical protein
MAFFATMRRSPSGTHVPDGVMNALSATCPQSTGTAPTEGGDKPWRLRDRVDVEAPNLGKVDEWSGRRESNSRSQLGKLMFCH